MCVSLPQFTDLARRRVKLGGAFMPFQGAGNSKTHKTLKHRIGVKEGKVQACGMPCIRLRRSLTFTVPGQLAGASPHLASAHCEVAALGPCQLAGGVGHSVGSVAPHPASTLHTSFVAFLSAFHCPLAHGGTLPPPFNPLHSHCAHKRPHAGRGFLHFPD